MCSPTYLQNVKPINVVQWLYHKYASKPEPAVMELQHEAFVQFLCDHGFEVEIIASLFSPSPVSIPRAMLAPLLATLSHSLA